jgi:hypothetical protein
MTTAIKINDDIANSARAESKIMSRSMTEQIEHWARIARVLEHMPGVSAKRVYSALRTEVDFDKLNTDERAAALGALESLTFNPKGDKNLQREKAGAGLPYTVLDKQGLVLEIEPDGRERIVTDVESYAAEVKVAD